MKIGLYHVKYQDDQESQYYLWQGYLKAYIEKYAPEGVFEIHLVTTLDGLFREQFDVVGLSVYTYDAFVLPDITSRLKELYNPVIVLGGTHATLFRERFDTNIDYVVIGEGEQTFLEMLLLLKRKRNPDIVDLEKISGMSFINRKEIVFTGPRQFIESLDDIPHPIRSRSKDSWFISTSRGCLFNCSFCYNKDSWGLPRLHSAEYIVEEINDIVEQAQLNDNEKAVISIVDNIALYKENRTRDIVDLLRKRGLIDKVRFSFSIRAELINENICQLFSELDIGVISIGLESACDRIMKIYKGNSASLQRAKEAMILLHSRGLSVGCSIIVGFFDETEQEVKKTFDFILNNMEQGILQEALISFLAPYPNTPIWDIARSKGFVHSDMELRRLREMHFATFDGFDEWIKRREECNSIYMCDTIPYERTLLSR